MKDKICLEVSTDIKTKASLSGYKYAKIFEMGLETIDKLPALEKQIYQLQKEKENTEKNLLRLQKLFTRICEKYDVKSFDMVSI